jgi:2-polyprenyl-3-methyl-5-hydroxy-6-metoxy-1,4-benzoquinol methylase
MEFTGERYMPHVRGSQISYEHWHRYHFTKKYIKNKIVADIACGEGYGSFYMAQFASKVIGIDISEESIVHARNTYSKDNITFIQSSAEAADLPEHTVDVIVSFETIEHLTEEQQNSFLNTAKKLLKPDGVLIISTPDKFWYTDIPGHKNEYHLREFYGNEFMDFLNKEFRHTSFFKQRTFPLNLIWQDNPEYLAPVYLQLENDKFVLKEEFIGNPLYYVAVCSDHELEVQPGSALIDESLSMFREMDDVTHGKNLRIQELENELQNLKKELNNLKSKI